MIEPSELQWLVEQGRAGGNTMIAANQTTTTLLKDLESAGFWGSIKIKFEGGSVVLIKKTETLKPNQRGNRGDNRKRG